MPVDDPRFNGAAPRSARIEGEWHPDTSQVGWGLQWSRAPIGADRRWSATRKPCSSNKLQWSRAPIGADSRARSTTPLWPIIYVLQWSRAPIGADRSDHSATRNTGV